MGKMAHGMRDVLMKLTTKTIYSNIYLPDDVKMKSRHKNTIIAKNVSFLYHFPYNNEIFYSLFVALGESVE